MVTILLQFVGTSRDRQDVAVSEGRLAVLRDAASLDGIATVEDVAEKRQIVPPLGVRLTVDVEEFTGARGTR